MDGEWRPVKSTVKLQEQLPARVRIYWAHPDALTKGVQEPYYKFGTATRIEKQGKYGGVQVDLDGGGVMMVKVGQFDIWRGA